MNDETARRSCEFISRAGADAEVAGEVADVLRRAGHTVQYQDEDIHAHDREGRYYLDGGWKLELLRNWQS
jgi:hypothetical protein